MEVAIDTGGTFTDCLGRRANGQVLHCKVLSTPGNPGEGLLAGLKALQAMADGEALTRIVYGTTIATNAILEGAGGAALLIVDEGFEDLLLLARQQRPELYALHPMSPTPALPRERVWGIPGRLDAAGQTEVPFSAADLEQLIVRMLAFEQVEAMGICLLHADRFPERERELAAWLGRDHRIRDRSVAITCSCALAPVQGEYERAVATALNARLMPLVGGALRAIAEQLRTEHPDAEFHVVASNGDALSPEAAAEAPVRLLLSGPAGGVQLGARLRERIEAPVLTLDMGGTSTDCAALWEQPSHQHEGLVAGFPVRVPMRDVATIGAGGGSILWMDAGGALQVGPQSAGADPGPACYGKGEQPTLTDAHVVLGTLPSDLLLAGRVQIHPERAHTAIATVANALGITSEAVARGALAIAEGKMARAIRSVSAARGLDPSQCRLAALGGAGGLHAVAVARLLGITEVIVPPLPGLGSAWGLAESGPVVRVRRPLFQRWPLGPEFLEGFLALLAEAQLEWGTRGYRGQPLLGASAECRYAGQEAVLPIPIVSAEALGAAFHAAHRHAYGYATDEAPIEIVALEVTLRCPGEPWPFEAARGTLAIAGALHGPLTLAEDDATLLIPAGASATLDADGLLRIACGPAGATEGLARPVHLTLAEDLLTAITEEMAIALEQSAHSSNIKDRRDLSSALFDADGHLLAQGAHIPVHLGSMETAVQAVRQALPLAPGETAIVNSPYHGGTHLPDITLITCVDLGGGEGRAYVVCRAHHADLGGAAPGSMPLSDRLEDEGILIEPTRFARGATLETTVLERIVGASRQPEERRGDLAAQLGANLRGAQRLRALIAQQPAGWFARTGADLQAYAARSVQARLATWQPGTGHGASALEGDGLTVGPIPIQVAVWLSASSEGGRELLVDFDGTAEAVAGPLNCPPAVATAALVYVLCCLMPPTTPLNSGLLAPVTLRIPPGSLLDPPSPRPTSAGNVETSQKIVEALLKAFASLVPEAVPAPSQGTMNNLLIGGTDSRTGQPFTYYETLAGGCGASAAGPGAHALHSHMTNSRNTPIEAVETRFPIAIVAYRIRAGSGGSPQSAQGLCGGDGVERVYRFRTPVHCTLIADWPVSNDPRAGARGSAVLTFPDGTTTSLPSKWSGDLPAETTLRLATPGGWAWDPSFS